MEFLRNFSLFFFLESPSETVYKTKVDKVFAIYLDSCVVSLFPLLFLKLSKS